MTSGSPMGYAINIPDAVYEQVKADCLAQGWDGRRLRRELTERLGRFVPQLMAEVLHDQIHDR